MLHHSPFTKQGNECIFRLLFQPTQASVAQLVEQLIRNERVGGSNPLAGSALFH